MWGISHEGRAEFDLAWRGYHREQVDRCFEQLEARLVEALTECELLAKMPAELAAAKLEIESLRQEVDRFRSVGWDSDHRVLTSTLETILGLAEDEAARIRQVAADLLAEAEREAEAAKRTTRRRSSLARRDFDLSLRIQREKEQQAADARRAAAEAEAREIVAEARMEAARLREEFSRQRIRSIKPAPSFLRWVARRRKDQAWA